MKQVTNHAYLLIGGNMGDRLALLAQAQHAISINCGDILQKSSIYETAAWGKTDQPSFLNQVLHIDTACDAHSLLSKVLQIENEMGRQRTEKYGPRLMDIDILLFNNQIINTQGLQVPHPQMQYRRFVLAPLAELAPDLMHPQIKISIKEMLERCTDPLDVHKL